MLSKQFEYKINDKLIIKFLKDCHKQLDDLSPLMKTARVIMKKVVDDNFETEGKATGEKWQEWSDSWKKKRIKLGRGSGKILTLDGELRRSIHAKSGSNFALVGTNKEYAALHNFGGSKILKRNKTMPKREFMRFDDYALDELHAELRIKFEDILNKTMERNLRNGNI